MLKCVCGRGFALDPAGGADDAPKRPSRRAMGTPPPHTSPFSALAAPWPSCLRHSLLGAWASRLWCSPVCEPPPLFFWQIEHCDRPTSNADLSVVKFWTAIFLANGLSDRLYVWFWSTGFSRQLTISSHWKCCIFPSDIVTLKYAKMRLRPRLRPGPRWGSWRRSFETNCRLVTYVYPNM